MTPNHLWKSILFAATLAVGLGIAGSARAQAPAAPGAPGGEAAPESTSPKGDPTYGYFATAVIAGLTMFLVCKSARR